jgi:hypothetical protein
VKIGRVLRATNMSWASLHRATEEPAFGATHPPGLCQASPRQAGWLAILLARADEIEREPPRAAPVEAAMQADEADTGNVVQLRPRARAL